MSLYKSMGYTTARFGMQLASRNGMIDTNLSKNKDWNVGAIVKVGFVTLRVKSVEAVYDSMPDIYTLESLDGQRTYEFIPHHGLTRKT